MRDWAVRRLAQVRAPAPRKDRDTSWGHARVEWPDDIVREGWLRAGDGMTFTIRAASEVAARLAEGGGRPGAHTPCALFGPELAVTAGGELIL